jgi:hypothetical protein
MIHRKLENQRKKTKNISPRLINRKKRYTTVLSVMKWDRMEVKIIHHHIT